MHDDRWLERWLPLIARRAGNRPVLELGCGSGRDSEALIAAGLRVVAIDRSPESIAAAKARVPAGDFVCQDLRAPFPASGDSVGVVVASLSLHYFTWSETLVLATRVRDALATGGIVVCRLNSINDRHYGAVGHARIERNYYRVDGEPKRFFDRADVDAMFAAGWTILHCEENVIHRYALPKAVWEIVVEKSPA